MEESVSILDQPSSASQPPPHPSRRCDFCGSPIASKRVLQQWRDCACPQGKWRRDYENASERQRRQERNNSLKATDLQARETTLRERNIESRERRQVKLDSLDDDTDTDVAPTDLLRADYRMEISLADEPKPPAILTRSDGATLLYEGRFNTVYGETAMGKDMVGRYDPYSASEAWGQGNLD